MIDKNVVKSLVDEWLEGKDYFLVDIEVSKDDRIVVEIDHADGVWIEDCVDLSRYIEDRLSRDEEDYELEVGSAGLGQPFKVPQQYVNFTGKEVEVLNADGKKYKGTLRQRIPNYNSAGQPATDGDSYQVQEGEDVLNLSIRFSLNPSEIRELNNLSPTDELKEGQIIKLPAGTLL